MNAPLNRFTVGDSSIDLVVADFLEVIERSESPARQTYFDRHSQFAIDLKCYLHATVQVGMVAGAALSETRQYRQATLQPSSEPGRSGSILERIATKIAMMMRWRCLLAVISLSILSTLLIALSGSVALAEEGFSEPEAEDFAYPLPWLKTGPVKERMKFASHRNGMLKSGWEGEPAKALAAAKLDYEAARKLCPNDPHLDYAYGLVLWKHDRRDEAIKQFDAAAHLSEKVPPFLPAAQAGAWGRLLNQQREAGWKQLAIVATVLSKSKGGYPTSVQKADSALFLGRAIQFLSGPGSSLETADADKRQAAEVVALIPEDLRSEFTRGREQIDKRHADLMAMANRPADEIVAEFPQKKAAFQRQRDEYQAEIARLNEQLDEQLKAQKEWLTQQQQQQLDQREKTLPRISAAIKAASRVVDENRFPRKYTEKEETFVREKGDSSDKKKMVSVEVPEPSEKREARLGRLAEAQKNGEELVQKRKAMLAEVQQLKAEKVQTNRSFVEGLTEVRTARSKQFRNQRELTAKVKQFEQDFQSPKTLKARVGQIAPYVPWDPDVEREALITLYRITFPASSSP